MMKCMHMFFWELLTSNPRQCVVTECFPRKDNWISARNQYHLVQLALTLTFRMCLDWKNKLRLAKSTVGHFKVCDFCTTGGTKLNCNLVRNNNINSTNWVVPVYECTGRQYKVCCELVWTSNISRIFYVRWVDILPALTTSYVLFWTLFTPKCSSDF